MSLDIWPSVSPEQLKVEIAEDEKHELDWLLEELQETLLNIKHGLEACYGLLEPIDPGSTLVLSTPRNEIVKGHITRIGTKIVKGTIHLRMKTLPTQSITIDPDRPIPLGPLTTLHGLLTHAIELMSLTLTYSYPDSPNANKLPPPIQQPPMSSPDFVAAQLRLLAQTLSEASALLRGPPTFSDPAWQTRSVPSVHFSPPGIQPTVLQGLGSNAPPPLSFHLSVQDGGLVLWLRSLEPADAPVHLGTKLALAIGTVRRLEHDEADRVFGFYCGAAEDKPHGADTVASRNGRSKEIDTRTSVPLSGTRLPRPRAVDVYVREKVRVESADPSLLSLAAKLEALGHALALARRNLTVVMGESLNDDYEDEDHGYDLSEDERSKKLVSVRAGR